MTTGAEIAANMTKMMADLAEGLTPLFETGAGIKTRLESEGWSPTMAEHLAGEVVASVIRSTLTKESK